MTPILESLGITDRTVKQMSQAEKEILRYIATLKQAKIAMGDMANTLESPSNQLKIFRQQLVETKVAVTSLFIGTFSNILPYANAFLMVVKEVSKAIATMFGIKLTDYNTGIASQEEAYEGLEDSIDSAIGKVKELKRQTLGFDEIHNINEDTGDNNGLGGISGGIDQRLLDAIKGYDNGMENVRMKATEIRDRIMEWLGFTKKIDSDTGEVNFKLKDGFTNLKLIGGIIATIAGFKLVSGITGLVAGTSRLGKLLGTGGLYTSLKKLIDPIKILGAKDGLKYIFLSSKEALAKFLPLLGKFSVAIAGIGTAIFGTKGTYNAMKQMRTESNYSGKEFKKYTAGILETVGGATALGTVLGGPLGAAIGALTGTIIAGTSAIIGYKQGVVQLVKGNLFGTISISTEEWTEILSNSTSQISNSAQKYNELKSELLELGDVFKANSETVDLYGYKFEALGTKISEKEAPKFIESIKNMTETTSTMIEKHTDASLKIWGDNFSKMSKLTEKEEKDILNSIYNYGKKQQEELKIAQNNITTTYDKAIKARGYLTDEEYNYIQTQLQKIRELTEKEMTVSQTNVEYYKKMFADKNLKLDKESYKNFLEALNNYQKEQQEQIEENYRVNLQDAEYYHKAGAITEKEYNDMLQSAFEERIEAQNKLKRESEEIQNKVIADLINTYNQVKAKNDEISKETKKQIESILKTQGINTNDLYSNYYLLGKKAGSGFSTGFEEASIIKGGGGAFGGGGGGGRFNANGGVYSNGSWKNIPQYANGGMPSHGSMFIAGERGAEIVGHINGRTEVLNQSQIASAIFSAVYSAMSQFNGQSSQIDVHVHTDEGTVVDRINQKTKQTGVCPVYIPIN